MTELTNETVLADMSKVRADKLANHFERKLKLFPYMAGLTYAQMKEQYDDDVSCFQQKVGTTLEHIVESGLKKRGMLFGTQVQLNKDGIIVGVGKKRGCTKPDFVFPTPVVGTYIGDYIVMSLKTSSRERAKLDGYFRTHVPKLFLYASLSDDYPHPEDFDEGPTRKLICATPRKNDTRQFKLGFEDIEATVLAAL
jgi:hypothetical protein